MSKEQIVFIDRGAGAVMVGYVSFFAMAFGLIGAGVYLASDAMQWLGFVAMVAFVLSRAAKNKRYTPQEAADHLLDKYGVTAGGTQ